MSTKQITVFHNGDELSARTFRALSVKLNNRGYRVSQTYSKDTELIVCIGGDGAFLKAIHACNFPGCPIAGINTGHLGFFQDVLPDGLEQFLDQYESGEYNLQRLSTVSARVTTEDGGKHRHLGLNEITIKGRHSYSVHLFISIGGKPIEKFSGDGLIVATSAGSTAYNYSVGGSIADPRLELLQVTPIAPMNTTAYRSFTSSILLPADLSLGVLPEHEENQIFIMNDGIETAYSNVRDIAVRVSDTSVHLLRLKGYDFWNKVKDKFL
ncbi:MAG: NAD(+)/NADH kinase [Bacillota bacterium]|nr:NAD(+)/NADH kinase [Bacillota bacterium]